MSENVWRLADDPLKYCRQDGSLYVSGQLKVLVAVRNLAPSKTVGIRYTTDNWVTWKEKLGIWCGHSDVDDTDEFLIYSESTLPPGCVVSYAICYEANRANYWDNNNGTNYTVRF